MKKSPLILLACVALTAFAVADTIRFDADGPGTANGMQLITGFTFSPGNALAHNVVPFQVGATFQFYQQMAISGVLDQAGNPVAPPGLNTSFELTVISSVTYFVTGVDSSGSTLTVNATAAGVQAAESFVQVYYDTTRNANPLTGNGYNNGTLILNARPTATGSITFVEQRNPDGSSQAVLFDQFGVNNYPGVLTVRATGSASTTAATNSYAQQFFSNVTSLKLNTSQLETPFTVTDPSNLFIPVSSGAGTLTANRGGLNGANGPDFQFQTSATLLFTSPSSIVVTTVDDHNDGVCNSDCTLREAIAAANSQSGGDVIKFAPGVIGTIELTGALPDLATDITIQGPGANLLTVRRNLGGNYRIFTISNGTTDGPRASIHGLTIANGQAAGTPANGGGLLNDAGYLFLGECTVAGNRATNGAGLWNRGAAAGNAKGITIIHGCTFSGNVASAFGGALFNSSLQGLEADCFAENSTFSGNSASSGAALRNSAPSGVAYAAFQACTVAGNTGTQAPTSVDGPGAEVVVLNTVFSAPAGSSNFGITNGGRITSHGGNVSTDAAGGSTTSTAPGGLLNKPGDLRNVDPKLDPAGLRFNGGPTQTIALQAGSPALNNADTYESTDQRGMARGSDPDSGAFELDGTLPVNLANISTRLRVGAGEDALIGGFIVTGTQPKRLLFRAIGPSSSVAGALQDPLLDVYSGGNPIASNDNWQDSADRQAIIDSGVAPSNNLESAIIKTLAPGAYTAIVRGANGTGGVGLVEVYDLDRKVDSKLANISTRGRVETGDNVMIAGFIVVGSGGQEVIVRAIGPSLPIAGKLADPTLQLYDSNGVRMASNNNWKDNQQKEIEGTTIPPANDLECALVRYLPPGGYTAIVRGVNDTTGVALVEVYGLE